MRKKEYERPTMQVVELKQQLALLAGSGSNAGVTDYTVEDQISE